MFTPAAPSAASSRQWSDTEVYVCLSPMNISCCLYNNNNFPWHLYLNSIPVLRRLLHKAASDMAVICCRPVYLLRWTPFKEWMWKPLMAHNHFSPLLTPRSPINHMKYWECVNITSFSSSLRWLVIRKLLLFPSDARFGNKINEAGLVR